jgi:hypothetical protein
MLYLIKYLRRIFKKNHYDAYEVHTTENAFQLPTIDSLLDHIHFRMLSR